MSGRAEDEADVDPTADEEVRHVRVMTIHRAKGLEFPIVIIPEVQEPLMRGGNSPRFLIYPNGGLDARLTEWSASLQTQSPRYTLDVKSHADDLLEEEMRIFYVGVTRAQQAVIFVGSDPPRRPSRRHPAVKDLADWSPVSRWHGAGRPGPVPARDGVSAVAASGTRSSSGNPGRVSPGRCLQILQRGIVRDGGLTSASG